MPSVTRRMLLGATGHRGDQPDGANGGSLMAADEFGISVHRIRFAPAMAASRMRRSLVDR